MSATTVSVTEAQAQLEHAGYYCEEDASYLYVRKFPNGYPSRLTISWLGTVSERSVARLLRKKGVE